MKALSIRQPWLWAILYAGKDVENRSRRCNYRGPVLLHASASLATSEYFEAAKAIESMRSDKRPRHALPDRWRPAGSPLEPTTDPAQLPLGGLCGIARIVGCTFLDPEFIAFANGGVKPRWVGWHVAGAYGIQLADVRPLPFLPCRGALGVPFDIEGELTRVSGRAHGPKRVAVYREAWAELGGT